MRPLTKIVNRDSYALGAFPGAFPKPDPDPAPDPDPVPIPGPPLPGVDPGFPIEPIPEPPTAQF